MSAGFSRPALLAAARALGQIYAAVFFNDRPWMGALCLVATLCLPNIGLAGLAAVGFALAMTRLFGLPLSRQTLCGYNSLLVGLSLGASFSLSVPLMGLIALGAGLAVIASVLLADLFWRWERLPALSMPFIVAALLTAIAAQSFAVLVPWHASSALFAWSPIQEAIGGWPSLPAAVRGFFTALGATFFVPHPLPGLLIALALGVLSRYMLLVAVAGFYVGASVLGYFAGTVQPELTGWIGFNFILTALALGAVFTVPGIAGFVLAMAGAALSAVLTAAVQNILLVYGLPVLALPFLLTTLALLACLRKRLRNQAPCLILDHPELPEAAYARAQLAKHRGLLVSEPLLALPFHGEWTVYQGFNGEHTHQAPWQHAVDFYRTRHGQSFSGTGAMLEDYYCFGLPVVAPVSGYVISLRQDMPDNPPGTVDPNQQHKGANWGNYVLLGHPGGGYVLLAHLRAHSVSVAVGAYVTQGQPVAACGNSGRSPQPHLHVQVQETAVLGSPTRPFWFSPVIAQTLSHTLPASKEFHLVLQPQANQRLRAPGGVTPLREHLTPRLGRYYEYEVCHQGQRHVLRLEIQIQFNGEIRLCSDTGASAAMTDTGQVMALYDRQGPADAAFDLWLLCFGLTPYEADAIAWQDGPAQCLITAFVPRLRRGWRLLPASLQSHYYRVFDPATQGWQQRGEHKIRGIRAAKPALVTRAWLSPDHGPVRLEISEPGCATPLMAAQLLSVGQRGDAGIPGWHVDLTARAGDAPGATPFPVLEAS